jgi:sugar O-acyltransferase (sialic acid O-acetyltransferase NeuD family)
MVIDYNNVKLVIAGVGFSDILNLVESIKESYPGFDFLGFVDDKEEIQGKLVFGYPVIGNFEWLRGKQLHVFNSVAKNMVIREKATHKIMTYDQDFALLVHPSINTRRSELGKDVAIFENVFLGPNSSIGSHTIVHAGSMIAHDVKIGENCFIAPGAQLLGGVTVGNNVFIGSNAVCLPKSKIEDGATIGAASVISGIVQEGTTMLGVPARKMFSLNRN